MRRLPSAVILSPNLGCPQLVAPKEVNSSAVVLVLATPGGEQPDWSVYAVKARPSYADEGQPFELGLSEPEMLELVLDKGHDCLTAQSFWDDGGKKIYRLRVRHNILGGSPDTMGFYPPNENYPYSQIAWLERVLASIQHEHHQDAGAICKCRVFVGLHAPPANLSDRD